MQVKSRCFTLDLRQHQSEDGTDANEADMHLDEDKVISLEEKRP